jgi:hypothetical protein
MLTSTKKVNIKVQKAKYNSIKFKLRNPNFIIRYSAFVIRYSNSRFSVLVIGGFAYIISPINNFGD